MNITLELWQLITLLIAFFGACGAVGKLLLLQTQRHLDVRFSAQEAARAANHDQVQLRLDKLEEAAKGADNEWKRVERELSDMQLDIALNYVRREDYIRGQSVVEAKLDGLATKLENLQLRGILDGKTYAN